MTAQDIDNQAQADLWTAAGPTWTARREHFDRQVDSHGLAAIDALDPAAGDRLVDVGCGSGTSTMQLAERVGTSGSVVGIDISPTMIEGATAHAASRDVTNVSFEVKDAMVDDFGSDFDKAFSRFGVMFFADAASGFRNIGRALREGGRLGFVCWQSPGQNPWASVPLSVASRHVDIPFGADPTAPSPFSLADPERIRAVLADAGFDDIEITPQQADCVLGDDLDGAIDFIFDLTPPAKALVANDPDAGARLRDDLRSALADWHGDDGVVTPSASWIVTAVHHG